MSQLGVSYTRSAKCDIGNTPENTPVKPMISAPRIIIEMGISDLKSDGFSKLVKRDQVCNCLLYLTPKNKTGNAIFNLRCHLGILCKC